MNPLQNFYEIIDVLKENKNGKVYLVYDKTAKQICVLKERNLKTIEIYKTLKKIKNPYLPEIYRAVEFGGKFFVVEEFVEGRTLSEILIYNNGLDEKTSARILKEICNGLEILHEEKIIHRDLKPSNIMLTKNNSVKLIDFSISRIEKENSEFDTDFLGTRGYAPPEQFGFGQTDARSDIFSLGITFQKILGENYRGYLKKILQKCTELDPAKRYRNVEEISADIDKNFFLHKLKNFSLKFILTAGIFLFATLIYKNFFEENNLTEQKKISEEVEEKISEPEKFQAPEKKSDEKSEKKFEWAEIKFPESPPIIEKSSEPVQKIPESPKKIEKNFDSINCTVLLHGENIFEMEFEQNIWENWRNDSEGENFYFPPDYDLTLEIENDSEEILPTFNIEITLGHEEKIFSVTILPHQSKKFVIPLGNCRILRGNFDIKIFLDIPEEKRIFWNGKISGRYQTKNIYLIDYPEWRFKNFP